MKKEKQKIFLYTEKKKPGKIINVDNLKYGKVISVNDFVKSIKPTKSFKNDT